MLPKEVLMKASHLIKTDANGDAIVSVEILDDIIRNSQKITSQKNFVPGHPAYAHGYPALQGFIGSARTVTKALINDGKLPSDKYMLLSCQTKSFGKQNTLVNTILQDYRDQDRMLAAQQREENPNSKEAKQPFAEDQLANISSNPDLNNPESHVVEETTKDGGRFQFDKINFEITVYKDDGTTVVFKLAPQGSWRFTVLTWIRNLYNSIAGGFQSIGKSIKGFFSKKKEEDKQPDLKVVNGEVVESTSNTATTVPVETVTDVVDVTPIEDVPPAPETSDEKMSETAK